MVTIKDIAAQTGFSPTTISIVLNNGRLARHITAHTKQVICDAAREMSYQPNIFARSLRARRSYTVGLLVYDILDPYCAPIIKRIETSLIPHNYTLLISDVDRNENRYCDALNIFAGRRMDGIIAIVNQLPFDLERLCRTAKVIPVVIIGRICCGSELPCVVVGDKAGGYLAARHLLDLGHREIGFIWDDCAFEWSVLRWKGICEAMAEVGVAPHPEQIVRTDANSPDAGYDAAQQLLNAGRRPTAVCAIDDFIAFGVIRAICAAGLNVPGDISVIGFDDLAVSRYWNPPLTTIAQPLEKLGEFAVEALLKRMASKRKAVPNRTIKPVLVQRSSTADPRRG